MNEEAETHTLDAGRHRLGPYVVGQRVVVRHLLSDGRATDVLGVCLAWGEESLVLDTDGGHVEIALATVVTGKPVPPRPSVRARVPAREIEQRVLSLWPADAVETEALGEWQLRAAVAAEVADRRRANSVVAMGAPGVADAVDRVHEWYAARGRRPQAQVVPGSDEEAGLLAHGWTPLPDGEAHCQLAAVSQALRTCNAVLLDRGVRSNSHHDEVTPRYMESGPRVVVDLPGARGEAALDGDWLGLHSIEVNSDRRRQGLGTAIVAYLLDWGAEQGARTAWLQVETANTAAVAAYARLTFRTHHTYRFLTG